MIDEGRDLVDSILSKTVSSSINGTCELDECTSRIFQFEQYMVWRANMSKVDQSSNFELFDTFDSGMTDSSADGGHIAKLRGP